MSQDEKEKERLKALVEKITQPSRPSLQELSDKREKHLQKIKKFYDENPGVLKEELDEYAIKNKKLQLYLTFK